MIDLLIVGAGGFGRELYGWLWDCLPKEKYRLKGFLCQDERELQGHGIDAPVCGEPATYEPQPNDRFLLAVGDVAARRRVVESLCSRNAQFLTMIHPTAVVASTAQIGQGVVLYPNTVVSNCADVADFVLLNLYSSAGHDSKVGRHSAVSPYATLNGFAVIEEDVFLGTHSTVGPRIRVGRQSKVCANTAVLQDVPPNSFVFGVPGKVAPQLENE